jgi:(p)ppGpp synthase/HD superfamily hydrolase
MSLRRGRNHSILRAAMTTRRSQKEGQPRSSQFSPELYGRALRFAAGAHGEQRVPGTEHPYVVHVCTVAAEVIAALEVEPRHDRDLAVACALLHDVVEDTKVGLDVVERDFGAQVAAGVAALTKNASLPKEQRMSDSLERIRRQPAEVWMVKLADRITNLQPPPPHWSQEKCHAYRCEAEVILKELGKASRTLAGRLRQRIADYRRLRAPDLQAVNRRFAGATVEEALLAVEKATSEETPDARPEIVERTDRPDGSLFRYRVRYRHSIFDDHGYGEYEAAALVRQDGEEVVVISRALSARSPR